jgi:peptidoglycan-associated lipoprotein
MASALVGCGGSSSLLDEDGYDDQSGYDDGAQSSGAMDDGFAQGSEFDDGQARGDELDNRVVYFAFDRADVKPEYLPILEAHGDYLAGNSRIRLRLEGHGDERGSREYNIGLGERRAQAVRQILLLKGASAMQLSTVSYGEERPAVLGSDEEAWSLNRRVELVYAE